MNPGSEEPPPLVRRRRRWLRWAVLIALPLLAVGHWWYWYHPRPRPLAPARSVLLRAGARLPVRLWLPYPHQNLAAVETGATEPREVLAAAARLADLPPPAIPRFGPFGLPPSREMVVATSADGESGFAAVRLYPVAAVLVRLAGALAGNPWLAGGDVEVDGRAAIVRWEGLVWWLETRERRPGEVGLDDSAAEGPQAATPVFAVVELAAPPPPLPRGRFVLRHEGADLTFRVGAAAPAAAAALREPAPALLMLVRRRPGRDETVLLLDRDSGLLAGIPAAAAWARPGGAVQLLPGGKLLAQLAEVPRELVAGGELVALDGEALALARVQASRFVPLATGTSEPPITFGAWLQVRPLARRARQLHGILADVPLLGDDEAQRWADVALLLEAASGYQRAVCWLAADGSAGELRLVR